MRVPFVFLARECVAGLPLRADALPPHTHTHTYTHTRVRTHTHTPRTRLPPLLADAAEAAEHAGYVDTLGEIMSAMAEKGAEVVLESGHSADEYDQRRGAFLRQVSALRLPEAPSVP